MTTCSCQYGRVGQKFGEKGSYVPRSTRIPALAYALMSIQEFGEKGSALTGNEVVAVCPLDAVRAGITVGVGHITSTIGPERVVETVVGPGLTWGTGTWGEGGVKLVSSPGKGKGTGDDGASGEESGERKHDEKLVERLEKLA